jgi:DNA-binding CsgD family transcriptional regulator
VTRSPLHLRPSKQGAHRVWAVSVEYQRALDFIEAAERAESLPELSRCLAASFERFGVPHFTLGAMLQDNLDAAPTFTTLVRGVTQAWSDHYWDQKYFNVDAAVHLALQRDTAFGWSLIENSRLPKSSARLFSEIRDAMAIRGGYVVPIHDEAGLAGIVALHHEDRELPAKTAQALKLISIYALERAKELRELERGLHTPETACPLSMRQREILAFAAQGKSEGDTGDILSIASTTVREHMTNIRDLLGVRTKTQAVVHAVRKGWIVP